MRWLLDQNQIDRFWTDGFLSLPPLVSEGGLFSIRRTLESLHRASAGFHEGALFDAFSAQEDSEPWRFPQILHPRHFAAHLVRGEYFHNAKAVARQLLGTSARFKADISFFKPARIGSVTPWHQDEAFLDPAWEYREVSFWLALQSTDRSNSCMEYIPGSHRGPVLPHGFPGGDNRIHALECSGGFDPSHSQCCELPAGGCVIHTQRTLHAAGPNESDRDRLAYVLIFNTVPTPARQPRTFPWQAEQQTARSLREMEWRRRGGLLLHLWRQRNRLRPYNLDYLLFDLRRATGAIRRLRRRD